MEKKQTNIKNLNQLGHDLMNVYSELRDGSIQVKTAEALANVAGKIIGSAKVVMEYKAYKAGNGGTIEDIDLIDENHLLEN